MSPAHPIHAMNEDVLLHIFTLNADMFSDGDDALRTTWITSQVCRYWRNLMLATPSLWARLIDMNRISQSSSNEWLDELLRRSGTAPLYIKAEEMIPFDDTFRIVRDNWSRIRKLVVLDPLPRAEFIRLIFGFPAPYLETFDVVFDDSVPAEGTEDAPLPPLFGGHAPILRSIHLDRHIVLQQTPWLRHLRSLVLTDIYSLRETLNVLAEMDHLQELDLSLRTNGSIPSFLPLVSLPCLKSMNCDGRPHLCAALLDHVDISLDCSLHICISSAFLDSGFTELELLSVVSAFTQYTQRFLKSNTFSIVHLNYMSSRCVSFVGEATFPVECRYGLSVWSEDHSLDWVDMTLTKLASLDLSRLKTLQFCSTGPLEPSFGSLFIRLPSVDTMFSDSPSLERLINLQDHINTTENPNVLFPMLKSLNLTIGRVSHGVKPALKFIKLRIQNGYPISVLDLESKLPHISRDNLEVFAEVGGLNVTYKLLLGSGPSLNEDEI